MYGGSLNTVTNREDWIEAIQFKDADTGAFIDLSAEGIEVTLAVRRAARGGYAGGGYPTLLGTIANGKIVLDETDPTIATWGFTAAEMRQLPPGDYDVGLTLLRDGKTTQIFKGKLPVTDGIVP